jgi:hypothetical protein
LKDLGLDERIILKWILKKYDGIVWTGFIWLGIGQVVAWCEHGNKPSGSIFSQFLDYLRSC